MPRMHGRSLSGARQKKRLHSREPQRLHAQRKLRQKPLTRQRGNSKRQSHGNRRTCRGSRQSCRPNKRLKIALRPMRGRNRSDKLRRKRRTPQPKRNKLQPEPSRRGAASSESA